MVNGINLHVHMQLISKTEYLPVNIQLYFFGCLAGNSAAHLKCFSPGLQTVQAISSHFLTVLAVWALEKPPPRHLVGNVNSAVQCSKRSENYLA